MPKNLILGIDAGLTRTKAALFDAAGREIAAAGVGNEIGRPFPGAAERSMDEAWADSAKAIRGALTTASASGVDVAAVGVTGAMVGVWPVDAGGRPIRPAVLVADTRGQEAIDRARADDADCNGAHLQERRVRRRTGLHAPGVALALRSRAGAYGARPPYPHLQGLAALSSHRRTGGGRHRGRGRPGGRAHAGPLPRNASTLRPRKQRGPFSARPSVRIDRRLRHRSGGGGNRPARRDAGRDRRRRRPVQRDRRGRGRSRHGLHHSRHHLPQRRRRRRAFVRAAEYRPPVHLAGLAVASGDGQSRRHAESRLGAACAFLRGCRHAGRGLRLCRTRANCGRPAGRRRRIALSSLSERGRAHSADRRAGRASSIFRPARVAHDERTSCARSTRVSLTPFATATRRSAGR